MQGKGDRAVVGLYKGSTDDDKGARPLHGKGYVVGGTDTLLGQIASDRSTCRRLFAEKSFKEIRAARTRSQGTATKLDDYSLVDHDRKIALKF